MEGVVRRLRRRVTGKNADIVPTLVFSSDFWRMARSHKVQRVIRWVDGGGRGGGEMADEIRPVPNGLEHVHVFLQGRYRHYTSDNES